MKYRRFVYKSYNYKINEGNLEISFVFQLGDIKFQPRIIIEKPSRTVLANRIAEGILDNLVFHLGLMEIPTYWKLTCAPEIIIEAGYLNKDQLKWWKNLIIRGMGQFFYENKIDWRKPNFLKIASLTPDVRAVRHPMSNRGHRMSTPLQNRYLVPFAGGRDSIVTLEMLKKRKKDLALFMVNPTDIIRRAARVSSIKKQIIVRRIVDKKLLKLNKKGNFFNGHTPFTSLLSFASLLCAAIFDYKNIVFSLEKSAEEGNIRYLGRIINHQWAKSLEFEKMFKAYVKKYLIKNINYFSLLRKCGELDISKMLLKYPGYLSVFSSCNASMRIKERRPASAKGSGVAKWCGNCPKCLFVYATFYPYLSQKQLLKIFGKDIFGNKALLPVMRGLLDQKKTKPFECVGTYKESKLAFQLSLRKAKKSGKLPRLLTFL